MLQAGILPSSDINKTPATRSDDIRLDSWKAIGLSLLQWTGHYLRSFAALCGSVIMWKGGYKLLDSYFLPTTLLRDILYMVLGLLLLTLTDTLSGNAGLSPLSFIIRSSFPDSSPSSTAKPSSSSLDNDAFDSIQMQSLDDLNINEVEEDRRRRVLDREDDVILGDEDDDGFDNVDIHSGHHRHPHGGVLEDEEKQ